MAEPLIRMEHVDKFYGRIQALDDVNMVVNYDFPPSAVEYIHRIGTQSVAFCVAHSRSYRSCWPHW